MGEEKKVALINKKNKKKTKQKEKKPFIDELLDWLKSFALVFVVIVLIFTFVAKTAIVNGGSMNNTLFDKDFLLLWSLLYTPQQGDIIAANCEGLNEVIVKRVIAVGGQEVNIDFNTGTVYVDGEVLDEPYIKNLTLNDELAFNYPITVDEGYYFCMGDNRQNSKDSRHPDVGLVSRDDILGKAIMRIYPLSEIRFFK
jgi:signal peptidase I